MTDARTVVDRWMGRLLGLVMGLLVVDVLWQVASRYLLAQPSSWTEELARFLLIWVTLLGAAYLVGQQGHIAIDVLSRRLSARRRRRVRQAIQGCVLVFALGVLVAGGGHLVYISFTLGQRSPALGVPLGYVYLIVPLSGLLTAYYGLDALWRGDDGTATVEAPDLNTGGLDPTGADTPHS